MWSNIIALSLSAIWLFLLAYLWHKTYQISIDLEELKDILQRSYSESQYNGKRTDAQLPFMEPLRYLEKLGWKASHKLERLDIVTKYRALTQTHKQHLASYIEMMPQLGLLGTVISLFLSAFVFDFNMQMLGLALTTTMFGLLAAIFARYFLEMKAEKCYHDILEFLQNQKVIDLITSQDVEETPNIETK